MRRLCRILLCAALVSTTTCTAGAALAQAAVDDAPRAEAKRKYTEATKAFEDKRYKDAIDLFLEADSFVPSAALAFNTALAYEAMGDAASALRWAREYLRRAPAAEDRAQVQATIDKLEARLRAKGVQQVTVLSTPAGATVSIDGRPVGVTPWTGELRPGSHRVELRLAGYQQAESVFELRPERASEVSLELAAQPQPPANQRAPEAVSAPDDASADALTIAGIVALCAGGAGFGTAIGLEVARAGAEEDVRTAELHVDAVEQLSTMEDLQLGARIAVGVGAGLALAGGSLLIAGLVSRSNDEAPPVAFGCSGSGCVFALQGRL